MDNVADPCVAPVSLPSTSSDLNLSLSSNRSNPTGLAGETHRRRMYIFATTTRSGVSRVKFWLDDPNRSGTLRQVEKTSPWDFAGGSVPAANPFDTKTVPDGRHTVTAKIVYATGSDVVSEMLVVDNVPGCE